MKSKKVLAILLSLAIMLTFMPTLAFAQTAEPVADEVTCTVTLSTGDEVTRTSLAKAEEAVDDGGSIVVEGKINNSYVVGSHLASDVDGYDIDYHDATLAEGKTVAPAAGACWVGSDGVFSYHKHHDFSKGDYEATAVPGTPTSATVVWFCGHGDKFTETITGGTKKADAGTDEVSVYHKTVYGIEVEWEVPNETTYSYSLVNGELLAQKDYVHANDGLAVFDAEGKVQFWSKYFVTATVNTGGSTTEIAKDENGKDIKLAGEIVKKSGHVDAKYNAYGYSTYEVKFTFPDETTATATFDKVYDEDYAVGVGESVKGIQYRVVNAKGEESWSTTYTETGAQTINVAPTDASKPVLDSEGSLTYRLVWNPKEGTSTEDIYGAATTLEVSKAPVKKACGYAKYEYNKISQKYTVGTQITTYELTLTAIFAGTHADANHKDWAKNYKVTKDPKHDETGLATADCELCGATGLQVVIPKTADHKFAKDTTDPTKDKVVTVEATCQNKGFSFKICEKEDDGWKTINENKKEYVLRDAEGNEVFRFTSDDKYYANFNKGAYHPVLTGTVTPKTDHKFYVSHVEWTPKADLEAADAKTDVVCTVQKTCQYSTDTGSPYTFVYHSAPAPKNVVSDGTVFYDAISLDIDPAADCTKGDKMTWTVDGVKDVDGNDLSTSVTSKKVFGPHSYKNTVKFSADGKTAVVVQQCTNKGCSENKVDAEGNKGIQTKDLEVEATENEDGSTTYTATFEGEDYTKTVFDLTKAEVTVNGGEPLDKNTFPESRAEANDRLQVKEVGSVFSFNHYFVVVDAATGDEVSDHFTSRNAANNEKTQMVNDIGEIYDEALKDIVEVTINGAWIDPDLYDVTGNITKGVQTITVTAAAETDAVGSAQGEVYVIVPGTLNIGEVTIDGEVSAYRDFDFDFSAHVVEVTKVVTGKTTVEGATVEYAVVDADETYDDEFDPAYLDYDEEPIELVDAGDYVVFAKLSKEGYTTEYDRAAEVEIYPWDLSAEGVTIKANKQTITYGSDDLVVTTGDEDIDEMIGLETIIAELNVGYYALEDIVTYDSNNFIVDFGNGIEVEKRNATVNVDNLTHIYDGTEVAFADAYSVEGLVNGDDLNVVVSVEGGKKPIEPGTYVLVATANNANYNIKTVNGSIIISKAEVPQETKDVMAAAAKITSAEYKPAAYNAVASATKALNDAIAGGNATEIAKATSALDSAVKAAANQKKAASKIAITSSKLKIKRGKKKAVAVSNPDGQKLTYAKVGGSKKVSVTADGKLKLKKKGVKKGKTYKVTVQVTAATTDNVLAGTATKTIKVKAK